jgi:cobaltochelatase CobN
VGGLWILAFGLKIECPIAIARHPLMHRLAAAPGGWNPDDQGVVFITQTPAPIVFLTAADTDIQTLAVAIKHLPSEFPAVRVANLLNLQQNLTIDTYADQVLTHAQAIVLRILGGRSYWAYGLEVVKELVQQTGAALFVLPGDDRPDPDLLSHSTQPLGTVDRLWRYLLEGGIYNFAHALQFIADTSLGNLYNPPSPLTVPLVGRYEWQGAQGNPVAQGNRGSEAVKPAAIGILFYRAHYLSGNIAAIAALCEAVTARGLEPVPVFVSSLRDPAVQADVLEFFQPKEGAAVHLVLNTTSFAIADMSTQGNAKGDTLWQRLNVPVFQVIFSGGTIEQWRSQARGLTPRDMAMNVALPEVDGRIITRAVSFKSVQTHSKELETDVVTYEPMGDRIEFVADLAKNWVHLRQTPVPQRKIALILANYPTRNGRLANGVGLDTPASCVEILKALHQEGYQVNSIPETGDDLIRQLTTTQTNDPEGRELRPVFQGLSLDAYQQYFVTLPEAVQQAVKNRWGDPNGKMPEHGENQDIGQAEPSYFSASNPDFKHHRDKFPIYGLQFGNIFVGIQPARGYDQDPALNYHAPDLEPTHDYLAFYHWVQTQFGAQAIAHIGKHGNLEWLPGKSIALSEECYPEVALGALPHLYPFIVNDPGEGAQAKRRAQAVIIDHLTPPMTRADLYGALHQLEGLVDEYYEAQSLDPSRVPLIRDRILTLIQKEQLAHDLETQIKLNKALFNVSPEQFNPSAANRSLFTRESLDALLPTVDGYLCELKEAQIRDGLHIFGICPQGQQLQDLCLAIARSASPGRLGLTRAIAQDWGLDFDPLTAEPAEPWTAQPQDSSAISPQLSHCRTVADVIEAIEAYAAMLIGGEIQEAEGKGQGAEAQRAEAQRAEPGGRVREELAWIATTLLPALHNTTQELTQLLRGFDGQYIPAGASGAPTRGRPEVLPTGRNFYSVDIRGLPTETAWDVGRKAAEALIERYTQENGDYPKTLGLSVWGTSTMRTGGDDIAEALALLGVRPVWEGMARRVIDFEILPLSLLGRPRVDVTLRISGFFRDAFANLIDLVDQAVQAVASLDEPEDMNPLAARVQQETADWQQQGLPLDQAQTRSRYRIFGSKPGAYGAGLQGLLEAQNWAEDADLARAYINWSSYAYSSSATRSDSGEIGGVSSPEAFERRLQQMEVVLHNQDNREHDLLDSDDYYQFQGGLTAAIRSLRGENPQTYFGDHSRPENPKIRHLSEEIARVYRSRVVNPKWIAGVMRHGYKGAFEMAATVDYLFAYDATAQCVEDFMYQGIAEAYVFDQAVQTFIQQKNPWALRDISERLLEAHQRGFWQTADQSTLDQLRAIALHAEGIIESW